MKDHEIRELVNQLRDIAIEYHGTQQLRERIARAVRAAMLHAQSDDDGEPTDDERIMAIEGTIKPISDCDTPVYSDAEKRIVDAVELLKKAAPAMLADNCDPDGPLAGRMKPPVIPDGYVMTPSSLLSELRDWAHPEIEEYCEMWAGRRDDEFPALRKVIADTDALLAAAPQSPSSEPATVPDKWIPVSEQMPEIGDIVLTAMGGVVNVGEMECSAANYRFFTSVISGRELPATHWMPLPAARQEVKQ